MNETAADEGPAAAYRHILLATDFSAHSRRAAKRAHEMAGRYGAPLSLLHVVEDLTLYDEFYDPIIPNRDELLAQGMEQARTMLDDLSRELGTVEAGKIGCKVLQGAPKSAIVACARRHGVDLVIVGSHGKGGARRLLGSVAGAVSHGAICDVLTIHI